ncbi:hypothetical protein ABZ614_40030 [Streptomyces sp. NPDC013178]|uniref:hypothetical protein n=1 Tax=Streptomyces sp. NPDC013178 TaxID=3155118 RepID=UPI0033FB2A91
MRAALSAKACHAQGGSASCGDDAERPWGAAIGRDPNEIETAIGYVLAVPKSQQVPRFGRIDHLFAQVPDEVWEKRSCGDGAEGLRVYHLAALQLPVIEDFDGERATHHRWALARRSISRPDEIAYYLGYAQVGTGVDQLVPVTGRWWAIEECFQATKNECGLDQYEVRR